jgi:hypothetical protein
MRELFFGLFTIVLIAAITLYVLHSYDPNPVLGTLNDCTTQIVGNCIVK